MVEFAATARLGNPMEADTQVGPITTQPQRRKVLDYIALAARPLQHEEMNVPAFEDGPLLSTLFTIVIVVIVLAGSLWVMFHMSQNMMPQMNHELQVMP
ncbi:hypothetical protein [Paracoccus mutanolyticus]|uniref:hypothetical protein n=1 Tax=Paracoccus mutanolyticus TaxID=1499308 RepID=UPI0021D52551|nr:hypothetical protein [Paracoccus mutanolyticus]